MVVHLFPAARAVQRRIVARWVDKGTRKLSREVYRRIGEDPQSAQYLSGLLRRQAGDVVSLPPYDPAPFKEIVDTCLMVTDRDPARLRDLGSALDSLAQAGAKATG